LRRDDEEGHVGTVVAHFGHPLGADILERRGPGYFETDEEYVRLRVRQRAEAIVVLPTCKETFMRRRPSPQTDDGPAVSPSSTVKVSSSIVIVTRCQSYT
jgi:hypothetical protein